MNPIGSNPLQNIAIPNLYSGAPAKSPVPTFQPKNVSVAPINQPAPTPSDTAYKQSLTTGLLTGQVKPTSPAVTSFQPPTTISSKVASTATPITVPQVKGDTTQQNLQATIDSNINANISPYYDPATGAITAAGRTAGMTDYTAQGNNQQNNGNNQQNGNGGFQNSNQSVLDQLNNLIGQEGQYNQRFTDYSNQYGLTDAQQQLQKANQGILASKNAYNQQLEQMRNQPGTTQEANAPQINDFQQRANADLANQSIIQAGAAGNLDVAQKIIQAKLDAEFKPIQNQIDALGNFYQLNQSNLTKSEQTQLENQRFQLQNNLDQLKTAKESAHQFALQNGITDPSVLQGIDAAQTPADVYAAVQGTSGGTGGGSGAGFGGSTNQYQGVSQQNQQLIDHSSDGIPYVDQTRLQNMTSYQKQIASQQYANAGIRVLDPQDVSALTTIDEAKQNLNLFENVANGLLSSGFMGRIKGFTTNQLAQMAQVNPDWRQFQTLRAGLIKSVQGVAAGAPGLRVTGAELSNAAESLPNSFDNKESAQKAVDTFRNQLDINRNVLLRGSAPTGTNSKTSSSGWASLGD